MIHLLKLTDDELLYLAGCVRSTKVYMQKFVGQYPPELDDLDFKLRSVDPALVKELTAFDKELGS